MSIEQPQVSILIPNYNSANYVIETLNSVLNQSYTNWECIIVDDHSTDNSAALVKEYCDKHSSKFKLFINPRKGACAARNYAFEQSTGEFIHFLDADDILSPTKIQKQVECLLANGKYLACYTKWARFTDPNAKDLSFKGIPDDKAKIISPIELYTDKRWGDIGLTTIPLVWLFHRDLFIESGGWNETLSINQDGEFCSRLLLASKGLIYVDDCYGLYRLTPNSISNTMSETKKLSLLASVDLMEKALRKYDNGVAVDKAICLKYQWFVFGLPDFSPQIIASNIKRLGGPYKPTFGGTKLKVLSSLVGFRLASFIINKLKKLKNSKS